MKHSFDYTEVRRDSWHTAKDWLRKFIKTHPFSLYRGHSDYKWRITSSLERKLKGQTMNAFIEQRIIGEFQRRAHLYMQTAELPDYKDDQEWMAMLQHHGAPTRLVDFTASPYVAAFFAFNEHLPGVSRIAIWIFDAIFLMNTAHTELVKLMNPADKSQKFYQKPDYFRKIVQANSHLVVFPTEPFRMNRRLTIQQGSFLCPGTLNASFEDHLAAYNGNNLKDHAFKLTIPLKERDAALADLNLMNISSVTLFPDLDGFARSLGNIPSSIYHHIGGP